MPFLQVLGKNWRTSWVLSMSFSTGLHHSKGIYMILRSMNTKHFSWTHKIYDDKISAVYMRQWIRWALVQMMIVAYSTPSHYLNQCWVIVNWNLRNKFQWNFNQNTKLFIHKNASENTVYKMAAILFRGRRVKDNRWNIDDDPMYTICIATSMEHKAHALVINPISLTYSTHRISRWSLMSLDILYLNTIFESGISPKFSKL